MEKHELSCSECKIFNKYMIEGMEGVIVQDYETVYKNIDSARDMIVNWRYDGKIGFNDFSFFAQMFNQAIETWCSGYRSLLIETLMLINDSFIKMMARYDIKCDC